MSDKVRQNPAETFMEDIEALSKTIYMKDDTLIINVEYEYAIALNRITSYVQVLGWVHHLCEKTWMTPRLIRQFINVALRANDLKLPYS